MDDDLQNRWAMMGYYFNVEDFDSMCIYIYICIGCGCLGNQVFGDHPCPFPQIDGSMYFSKIIGTTPGITSFYVDL